MEHRYAERIESSVDVIISNMTGKNLKGRLRYVSRDGMFIRTDSQRVHKGETLDIKITNSCIIRGWVVHVSDEGIGILLVTPTALTDLRADLPAATPIFNTQAPLTGFHDYLAQI